MSLLKPRLTYSPFEYPQAYEFWEKQQQAHWLPNEISMAGDIADWKQNLSENEKKVLGNVLRSSFVNMEIFIGDYWSNKAANWFKKPEIQMMANTFSSMESIHAVSYALLNQTLGLDDFEVFLQEPTAKAKIDRMIATKGKSKEDIARSLAVFSAFNEGVSLFSSFAILMNFPRFNKMKGLGQIIAFSIRDESLHSEAGCWLFNTFIEQNPDIWTDELKKDIYDASRLTVKLEDDFIDKVFENGEIEGLNSQDIKNYVRFRANTKLNDIGLKQNWKNIDKDSLDRMEWFSVISGGVEAQDFFSGRVSSYSKGVMDFSKVWE
jgi:ribonucleoside-diphosphate reductase beta chain